VDVAATVGDVLVFVGLVIAGIGVFVALRIYRRQQYDSDLREINATTSLMTAVRDGIRSWGHPYFLPKYDHDAAEARAEEDAQAILHRSFRQNFRVPTDPLVSLIMQPGEGRFVTREVTRSVNIALSRMGQFNQLVQEQTDFLGAHLPQIYNPHTNEQVRGALADSARQISMIIHGTIIGNDGWYNNLVTALDMNIVQLQSAARWSYDDWKESKAEARTIVYESVPPG
jgi:hypothetical protein